MDRAKRATLSLLALIIVIFVFSIFTPLSVKYLYAFSIGGRENVNWIEFPEFEVIRSQYFLEGDETLLEDYRVQETDEYFFMGVYDKAGLSSGAYTTEESDTLTFFGRIRYFFTALIWGEFLSGQLFGDTERDETSIGHPEEISVTFSEKLKELKTDFITSSGTDALLRRKEALKNAGDAIVSIGKDFSLEMDAFSQGSDLNLRFISEEGFVGWYDQGIVHFLNLENEYVVSYFYDSKNQTFKEWFVFFSPPPDDFNFRRSFLNFEKYKVERMIDGRYEIRNEAIGDNRPWTLSRPRVIRPNLTDLDEDIENHYNSGTFSMAFNGNSESDYPILIERDWAFPSQEELEAYRQLDEVELEKDRNQDLLDQLQSIRFSYESNNGQYPSDVLFAGYKHHASYFLQPHRLVSQWFIPYDKQGSNPVNTDVELQRVNEPISVGSVDSTDSGYGYGYGYGRSSTYDTEEKNIVCRETRPLLSRLLRENDRQYVFGTLHQLFIRPFDGLQITSTDTTSINNHSFRGNDPSMWMSGVESTNAVLYQHLYEGVDLLVGSDEVGMTQAFYFHSGTEIKPVSWRFPGVEKISFMKNGDLVADVGICEVGYEKPYALYADGTEELINVRYELSGRDRISFEISSVDSSRDFVVYMKMSPQRSNCINKAMYEDDFSIAPLSNETFYIAGYTSSPFHSPVPFHEYQCIEGREFDPEIRLVDRKNKTTLFKTIFGGSEKDSLRSMVLDVTGMNNENLLTETSDSEEIPLDEMTALEKGDSDSSKGNVFLTVLGETLSPDFPGIHYLEEAEYGPTSFEMSIDENGFLFINDNQLLELVKADEASESFEPSLEDTAAEEEETQAEGTEEPVTEATETTKEAGLLEGELKGAAEEMTMDVEPIETEILQAPETVVSEIVPGPTLEEVFSGKLEQLIQNPYANRFDLQFIPLTENTYEVRFVERESGIPRASLELDLTKLAERIIQIPSEKSSEEGSSQKETTSFWEWISQAKAQVVTRNLDLEQVRSLVEKGDVSVDLSSLGLVIENDDFRLVIRQEGTLDLFTPSRSLFLENTNRGAGVIICPQALGLDEVTDDCPGRLVIGRADYGKKIALQSSENVTDQITITLLNEAGQPIIPDKNQFNGGKYYVISGVRAGGVQAFGFRDFNWVDHPSFLEVKKDIIANYENRISSSADNSESMLSHTIESEQSFHQGGFDLKQLRETDLLVPDDQALDPQTWTKPEYDTKASEIRKIEFQQQGFLQSLIFSPNPIFLNQEEEKKYEGLSSSEVRVLNQLERSTLSALQTEEVQFAAEKGVFATLSKDFSRGVQYRTPDATLRLQPLREGQYDLEVQYGVVQFINRDTNNEVISYYFEHENSTQKEWIVLNHRPAETYSSSWVLLNHEQYSVTRTASGDFQVTPLESESSFFLIRKPYFIDGNGDRNDDHVELVYLDGIFTLSLIDQQSIQFPIAIDPSVVLVVADSEETENTGAPIHDVQQTLPLLFQENKGQVDAQVKYLARQSGFDIFFVPGQVVYNFLQPREEITPGATLEGETTPQEFDQTVFRQSIRGAKEDHVLRAEGEQEGKVHFYRGSQENWIENVSTFDTIVYQSIYQGVDLRFSGSEQMLKYEFELEPGIPPSVIELEYTSESSKNSSNPVHLSTDTNGNLIISTPAGDLLEKAPYVYQVIHGVKVQKPGRFTIRGSNRYGFEVDGVDPGYSLIIDPFLAVSGYLGGASGDFGYDIEVDSAGNIVVVGGTLSSNFPSSGAIQSFQGGQDIFVTKLNPKGTALIFSTFLGSDKDDESRGISIDDSDNIYIAGRISSSGTGTQTYPTTASAYATCELANGDNEALLTRLSSSGTLGYSTCIRGTTGHFEHAEAVEAVNTSKVFVGGTTMSASFPTVNAFQGSLSGSQDAFIAEFNTNNSGAASLVNSSYIGGTGLDSSIEGLSYESGSSALYLTFDLNAGGITAVNGFQTGFSGISDIFVARLSSGFTVSYSTYLGGTGGENVRDLTADGSGNVYVVGSSSSSDFPLKNAYDSTLGGTTDAFVTKINTNATGASSLVYSTFVGGSQNDQFAGVEVDGSGRGIAVGWTQSSDYPTSGDAVDASLSGTDDGVVTVLNSTGNSLAYSSYYGGSNYETLHGSDLVNDTQLYIVGVTQSNNLPGGTLFSYQAFSQGGSDALYARYSLANGFYFPTNNTSTGEAVGSAQIEVRANTPLTGSVDYVVTGGTAIVGDDYTFTNGTLNFSSSSSELITFSVINDVLYDGGTENIQVTLQNPSSGLVVVPEDIHTYSWSDNDTLTATLALQPDSSLTSTVNVNSTGGFTTGTHGVYRWRVDPDGSTGPEAEENYMVLNMPFSNSGTVESPQTDFSGNENHGNVSGGTYTTSGCQVGGCMELPGSSRITISDFSNNNFTDEITFSMWVSSTNPALFQEAPLAKGNNLENYTALFWASGEESSDTAGFYIQTTSSTVYFSACGFDEGTFWDGTWHHLVGTYDRSLSSNQLKMYVDGAICEQITVPDEALRNTSGGVYIGGFDFFYFDGKVDEVQIYPRALSAAQIAQLYTDNTHVTPEERGGPTVIVAEETGLSERWRYNVTHLGSIGGTVTSNAVNVIGELDGSEFSLQSPTFEDQDLISTFIQPTPWTGSVAYRWTLDPNGTPEELMSLHLPFHLGTTQSDVSGNGYTGSVNGTTITNSGCHFGWCGDFDGVNDYLSFGDVNDMGLSDVSISVWVAYDGTANTFPQIINKYNGSFGYGIEIVDDGSADDGKIRAWIKDATNRTDALSSSSSLKDGNWHHVVVVWDRDGSLIVYVDNLMGTPVDISAKVNEDVQNTESLVVGAGSSGVSQFFGGRIDDVQMYPRVLSSQQIKIICDDGDADGDCSDGIDLGVLDGTPSDLSRLEHEEGQIWQLQAYEITSGGELSQPFDVGTVTIQAGVGTVLSIDTPASPQDMEIDVSYSCSNSASSLRDFDVHYRVNAGGWQAATLTSVSSGSIDPFLDHRIIGADCLDNTSTNTFTWDSYVDGVALGTSSSIEVRITTLASGSANDITDAFTVENPLNLCAIYGNNGTIDATYDGPNSNISIDGCLLFIHGSHQFKNVYVRNFGTLTHPTTTTVTMYSIDLNVATFTVDATSSVNLNSRGYPVLYTAGVGGAPTTTGASTEKCGGSHGGRGGRGDNATCVQGVIYDSITEPIYPGGGSGNWNSSNYSGGGAIKITASSITVDGTITANGLGGTSAGRTGSAGGSIWLISSGDIFGSGTITANGGNGSATNVGSGGGGRISIEYGGTLSLSVSNISAVSGTNTSSTAGMSPPSMDKGRHLIP